MKNIKHGTLMKEKNSGNHWFWLHDSKNFNETNPCIACVNTETAFLENTSGHVGNEISVEAGFEELAKHGYEVKDNKFVKIEEKIKPKFKAGDIVSDEFHSYIYLGNDNWIGDSGNILHWGIRQEDRHATQDERDAFLDKLSNNGHWFNFRTLKLEPYIQPDGFYVSTNHTHFVKDGCVYSPSMSCLGKLKKRLKQANPDQIKAFLNTALGNRYFFINNEFTTVECEIESNNITYVFRQ